MNGAPTPATPIDPRAPKSVPDGATGFASRSGDFFFTDADGNELRQLDAAETTVYLQISARNPTPQEVVEIANVNRTSLPIADDAAQTLSPAGAQATARPRPAGAPLAAPAQPLSSASVPQPPSMPAGPLAPPVSGTGFTFPRMSDAMFADAQANLRDRISRSGLDRAVQTNLTQDVQAAHTPEALDAVDTDLQQRIAQQQARTQPAAAHTRQFLLPTSVAFMRSAPSESELAQARADAIHDMQFASLDQAETDRLLKAVNEAKTRTDFENIYATIDAAILVARAQTAPLPAPTATAAPPPASSAPGAPAAAAQPAATVAPLTPPGPGAPAIAQPAAAAPGTPPAAPAAPLPQPPRATVRVPAPGVPVPAPAITPAAGVGAPPPAPGAPAPAAAPAIADPAIANAIQALQQNLQQQLQDLQARIAAIPVPAAQPPAPAAPVFVPPQAASALQPVGFVPANPQPHNAHGVVGINNGGEWWVQSQNGTYYRYADYAQAASAAQMMSGMRVLPTYTPAVPTTAPTGDPATAIENLVREHDQAAASLLQPTLAALTLAEEARMQDPQVSPQERDALRARMTARQMLEAQQQSSVQQLQRIQNALARQHTVVLAAAPSPAIAAHATRAHRSIRQVLSGEQQRIGALKYIFNWQTAKVIAYGAGAGAIATAAVVATGGTAALGLGAAIASGSAAGFGRTFAEKGRAYKTILEEAQRERNPQRKNELIAEANALSVSNNLGLLVFNTMLGGAAGGVVNRAMEWSGLRDLMVTQWGKWRSSGAPSSTTLAGLVAGAAPSGRAAGTLVMPAKPIGSVPVAGPRAATLTTLGNAPRVGAPQELTNWVLEKRGTLIIPGYGQPQQCGIDVHGRKLLTQLSNGGTILDTIIQEKSWGTPRCLAALRGQFDLAFKHPSGSRMAGIFLENYQGRTAQRAVLPNAIVDTLSTVRGRATTVVPGIDIAAPAPGRSAPTLAEGLAAQRGPTPAGDIFAEAALIRRGGSLKVGEGFLGTMMATKGSDGYVNALLLDGKGPLSWLSAPAKAQLNDAVRGVLVRNPQMLEALFPGRSAASLIRNGDIIFPTGATMNPRIFAREEFAAQLYEAIRSIPSAKNTLLPELSERGNFAATVRGIADILGLKLEGATTIPKPAPRTEIA